MVDSGAPLPRQRDVLPGSRPYEVLAAKNATVRLRSPSGHVYSFTDLTCAHGAVNFGHLNPDIDPFECLDSDVVAAIYPPAAKAHANWLLKKLRLRTHKMFYTIGNFGDVSAAVELAQRRRPGKVVAIDGSCHGRELAAAGQDLKDCCGEPALHIAPGQDFSAWDSVSCLIYEPIQGRCGYLPLPLPWLRGLSHTAQVAGVTVIADETQCGFYRFGQLSLAASEFLRPDIFVFGNSMTNGIYPLFAIVYPNEFERSSLSIDNDSKPTFQTSLLGLRAAERVAAYIDSTDLDALITEIHSLMSKTGVKLAANPILSSFHLAGPTLSFEVRDARAAELVLACEARGVLVSAGAGGRRVRVAPPLTIARDQLKLALKQVVQAAMELRVASPA